MCVCVCVCVCVCGVRLLPHLPQVAEASYQNTLKVLFSDRSWEQEKTGGRREEREAAILGGEFWGVGGGGGWLAGGGAEENCLTKSFDSVSFVRLNI